MKKSLTLLFFAFAMVVRAQSAFSEQPPVFPDCRDQKSKELEACFYAGVQDLVFDHFKLPDDQQDFKGNLLVLFEVDVEGKFKTIYVDAPNEALVAETKRVFGIFPTVGPALYNGVPTYAKYTIKIEVPVKSSAQLARETEQKLAEEKQFAATNYTRNRSKELAEYDSIVYHKFDEPKFDSHLNIPFSHSFYAQFDDAMNQVGANNHTAVKPYTYAEVSRYYNLREANQKLMKNKTSWFGRKLWNENTVQIQGEGYWFTLNPVFDLQMGRAESKNAQNTYLNTRALQIQGALGRDISFTTTIYESQGRFAGYYNRYAESLQPSGGGNPAVIPGIGVAKGFKKDSYDMPNAEANISYTPGKIFNLQLGYGRNFIGDGYRSLIVTDGVSNYPYFKLNTTFWKIRYTNTYMFLRDVRPEVTLDRTYATKYMANHYLSWNATKRLNIGFFESVIWANANGRGFDMAFFNPIIFYRSVEFASSPRSGNALLGLTSKYKINNQLNVYGQFLLDEFSLGDIKDGDQSWKNKFGYQIGAKYFNAFNVENLLIQAEYNHVRPYVYAHSEPITNYAHTNQSLGHQWGGNFREVIAIARYHKGRYFADAKFTIGKRGLDFNTATDTLNYGGNIYRDYDLARPRDKNVRVGQGNTTSVFIADVQAGYLINPATNLKLFVGYIHRNFNPLADTPLHFGDATNWVSVGLRSDIFNWYYDY